MMIIELFWRENTFSETTIRTARAGRVTERRACGVMTLPKRDETQTQLKATLLHPITAIRND